MEQEKELQQMLNMRYGWGTWDELTQMRRKIRAQREKEVYKQAELRKDFIETVTIVVAGVILLAIVIAGVYWIGSVQGKW